MPWIHHNMTDKELVDLKETLRKAGFGNGLSLTEQFDLIDVAIQAKLRIKALEAAVSDRQRTVIEQIDEIVRLKEDLAVSKADYEDTSDLFLVKDREARDLAQYAEALEADLMDHRDYSRVLVDSLLQYGVTMRRKLDEANAVPEVVEIDDATG